MQPILKVDLSSGEFQPIAIPSHWEQHYLGGASLAARILFEHITPEIPALDPRASLLILTGPLTGTAGPAVGRFVVCGRSPATGLWGESNIGGFWGPELRKAGFDGLWITGRAASPVYLSILHGKPQIRPADHLWGLDTYQIQTTLQSSLDAPQAHILGIGPAGEAQIPSALLLCDHGRVAGRTGMGAVMGSKNLKAIAVQGSGKIPLAQPADFNALRSTLNRDLRADNFSQVMRELGSAGASDYFDYLGEMPKKYFSSGVFEGASQISGASVRETILSGVSACHACVIACGRVVKLEDGQKRKGPEYETLVGFGPNLLINDPVKITLLGELCDRYGLDVITTSGTIGLAFSLFEQGVITSAHTGGLELRWGDAEVVTECIHRMVKRQGFGKLLAQGSRSLGAHFGAEEQAIQVNGLELAYHDPRGASGMALVYATSPRGACHNQSDYFLADIGQVESSLGMDFFDRHQGAEKAANVARHQNWRTVCNALVLCFFANVPPQPIAELTAAATGFPLDLDSLLQSGERGWNLKRMLNRRLGLTRRNDTLPKPLLQPLPDGGAAGYRIPLDEMLTAYYQARSWDAATGFPTPEKLRALDLLWTLD